MWLRCHYAMGPTAIASFAIHRILGLLGWFQFSAFDYSSSFGDLLFFLSFLLRPHWPDSRQCIDFGHHTLQTVRAIVRLIIDVSQIYLFRLQESWKIPIDGFLISCFRMWLRVCEKWFHLSEGLSMISCISLLRLVNSIPRVFPGFEIPQNISIELRWGATAQDKPCFRPFTVFRWTRLLICIRKPPRRWQMAADRRPLARIWQMLRLLG